jgi:hypothetical protein
MLFINQEIRLNFNFNFNGPEKNMQSVGLYLTSFSSQLIGMRRKILAQALLPLLNSKPLFREALQFCLRVDKM